jgi:hypothetical protein
MKFSERRPWVMRAATFVCVLLLALLTCVQAAHVHPLATDADHCPVCVVMHSAAPVSVVAATVVSATGTAPVALPVVHTVVRAWHCTLFNRPPPVEA